MATCLQTKVEKKGQIKVNLPAVRFITHTCLKYE